MYILLLFLSFGMNGTEVMHAQSNRLGIRTEVRYDYLSDSYIFEDKIGEIVVGTPYSMSPREYMEYRLRKGQTDYFRKRNALGADTLQTTLQPLVKPTLPAQLRKKNNRSSNPFGIGGLRLTTQGSVEISAGMNRNVTDNPTLPQRARKRSMFDFDQQIQLNVNAKVGDKIDFDIHYDTEASFDFQSKQLKLAYQGNEDEIIQRIEAGNVSMQTKNSLIQAGNALFGIKSELQFGKLRINSLFSQQQSESQTINTRGGVQTIPYEFSADQYEENKHFFLGYWFREKYDDALEKAPYIQSAVSITKIEVWVTNKRGDYAQARNIVAFADLGEWKHIHHTEWMPQGSVEIPYNRANSLYEQLTSIWSGARVPDEVVHVLPSSVIEGVDYEKLENARLLAPSEYTFQPQLGYISLNMPLHPDEVLAVAYEYTFRGEVFQVGEFSTDVSGEGSGNSSDSGNDGNDNNGNGNSGKTDNNSNRALFLKLLKPVSLSPKSHTWDLMMKNIYSMGHGAYNVQRDLFRLQVTWQSDTAGVYLNFLPESGLRDKLLLQLLHLDRLNSRNDPSPDGNFDFLEGYTVDPENGLIIFPVVEPFGSYLRKMIGNDLIAEKYVYQELYDSTLTVARQLPEKNKFRISGEYRGSSGSEINLNAMNVARGSVRVTAAGMPLTEGIDYTVDYLSGTVKIINQAILSAGTPVSVTLESQLLTQMQRKTLMGIDLQYAFSKYLSMNATLMHYYEKPLTMKAAFGDESAKNTLWGTHMDFKKQLHLLTNLLDMLPFVEATAPSELTVNLDFAQLLPGHYKNKFTGGYSYIDDFESSTSSIDLRTPYAWSLASTPYNNSASALFPEASLSNNIEYGKNRAHLAWFYIDGIFTRKNSNLTPAYIRNDTEQLSDHRVREVYEREIFPNRDAIYGQPTTLPVLNLSYYPNERGPYNLDTDVDGNGLLRNPRKRWGGITRRLDIRDFEAANIEYIEFWLMDPFVNDTLNSAKGGDLYFNLGEISEDILKDGMKFFENGLPVNEDTTAVGTSVWGKYPKRQSTVYGFDNSLGMESRRLQDVGLNGLSSEEEKRFPTYANYLNELKLRLSGETLSRMEEDAHSPLNDPAGDSFRHYRGEEQDKLQLSILERYKYYNNTEGNSLAPKENDPYHSAARTTPDVEDIDNDNTMNGNEAYYQYKVSLRPEDLVVGSNFITDKREVSVRLRNGKDSRVTWYQFRIPIREYQSRVGNIQGFNNIRFMRMFLTGFEEATFLRFATLELVRSEWRSYNNDLMTGGAIAGNGSLEISAVNIEENGSRTPVNYLLPPGVTRILDPGQPQLRQENEQSLSLKVNSLDPGDARAVYKNSLHDLRRYKRLQMFVHAEALQDDANMLQDGELSIFLRLGSDYRNNYYEYEIPLRITQPGQYSSHTAAGQMAVWPMENMFDFSLDLFTKLKISRNTDQSSGKSIDIFKPFTQNDPEKPDNRIRIVGNPSLAEVKVLMIGIRNNSRDERSGEIWVNEMRLSEFDEKSGWAAQGDVNLTLSDLGVIHYSGRTETAGFGAIDHRLQQRRNDDYYAQHFTLNLELGRFLPRKVKIIAPLNYVWSNESSSPLYDPFNQDILLKETLKNSVNRAMRDSLKNISHTHSSMQSLTLHNVKVDLKSKIPMPYDPTNFVFGFSRNEETHRRPDTEYTSVKDFKLQANYNYSPNLKPWGKLQFKFLPSNIRISNHITRHYQETKLRNQDTYLSFSSDFYWDRDFSLTWDVTRNLYASFRSGTVAEIEEPYLQVNREINRSDYEVWKDTVMQSIRDLGEPLRYIQTTDITYTLPFMQIEALNWITGSAAYNAGYRWERGALVEQVNIGNFLQNDLSYSLQSRFNLNTLYNKFDFLRQANNRSGSSSGNRQRNNSPGFGKSMDGVTQIIIHLATMVRQINFQMGYKMRTDLPGYNPIIGDFFGQKRSGTALQPGLTFAFGLEGGEQFVRKSLNNNLLVINEENIRPAIFNRTQSKRLDASIDLIPGLSINLHALHEQNRRTEMQFMFDGMPTTGGGSFAMSIVSTASAFEHGTAENNYRSAAFSKLQSYREELANRVRAKYVTTSYPSKGFLTESSLSGKPFDTSVGDVHRNSANVLIPAFLAAYMGKDPTKIGLDIFPAFSSILPNWNVNYSLTSAFPSLQLHLRSLTINHQYVSQYRIGSFGSFLSWVPAGDDDMLGFIRDATSGAPIPSSPFDISSVSIVESFNPLIEMRSMFLNDLDLGVRINRTRTVNLNLSSVQIVETSDNDMVVGLGYRIAHFDRILGISSMSNNASRRSRLNSQGLSNTLTEGSSTQFNNYLNLKLDISHKVTRSLIRKIESGFTQAIGGIQTTSIRFAADYALSSTTTLRAFYDKVLNRPFVSSGSYATANTSAGISLRFNLNQ